MMLNLIDSIASIISLAKDVLSNLLARFSRKTAKSAQTIEIIYVKIILM